MYGVLIKGLYPYFRGVPTEGFHCMYMACDGHVTYILEYLPGALCCLYEGHVVVEGQLLGGVEDTPSLLSQVLRLKLYMYVKE